MAGHSSSEPACPHRRTESTAVGHFLFGSCSQSVLGGGQRMAKPDRLWPLTGNQGAADFRPLPAISGAFRPWVTGDFRRSVPAISGAFRRFPAISGACRRFPARLIFPFFFRVFPFCRSPAPCLRPGHNLKDLRRAPRRKPCGGEAHGPRTACLIYVFPAEDLK